MSLYCNDCTPATNVKALRLVRDNYMAQARLNRDFGRIKAARNQVALARSCNRDLLTAIAKATGGY